MTAWRRVAVAISVLSGLAIAVFYLDDQLRTRSVTAREEMVWQCTDRSPLHPGRIVLLRYLRAPEYFGYREDPTGSFCRFVSQTALPTVWVVSEVRGNKKDGLHGWTEETMDGHPIPLGFNGGDGVYGQPSHTFPYQDDFQNALRHHGFGLLP